MCNLFIIGNGFDIANRLPTSFSHFRKYLKQKYSGVCEEFVCYPPQIQIGNHGEAIVDINEVAKFFLMYLRKIVG